MGYRLLVVGMLVVLVLLQYQLWFGSAGLLAQQKLTARIDDFKVANEQLGENNDALRQQVKDLKHGVDLIEELARYELNLIGEDETFFRYVEGVPEPESQPQGSPPNISESDSP